MVTSFLVSDDTFIADILLSLFAFSSHRCSPSAVLVYFLLSFAVRHLLDLPLVSHVCHVFAIHLRSSQLIMLHMLYLLRIYCHLSVCTLCCLKLFSILYALSSSIPYFYVALLLGMYSLTLLLTAVVFAEYSE